MIKVLNLYAGIGGNRKLWENVDVTAVELDPDIAKIYQDFFPDDRVIVADAHGYLLEHYSEFDFIWSSPPCPSHSRIRKGLAVEARKQNKPVFPDMQLYEEILFLQGYFKGLWVVENVVSWYEPLIKPQEINRHYFWANFYISAIGKQSREHNGTIRTLEKRKGFNLDKYTGIDKCKTLRNCVEPETGRHIFDCAFANKDIINHTGQLLLIGVNNDKNLA
jgi:DNA (cytosine-5)-methyltransferase 1